MSRLLLVSVEHTGTRVTMDHLALWGLDYAHYHTDAEALTRIWGTRPAIVTIRDPYMCLLSWWKRMGPGHDPEGLVERFITRWELLHEYLDMGSEHEVWIHHIDRDHMRRLADELGVEYRPITETQAARSVHHITDEWIQPIREKFPPEIRKIAERWGY